MADVFISYSRRDLHFVQRLHEAIAAHKHDSWVDWRNIPPTAEWLQEIIEAIEGANAFLFILSEDSVKSEICRRELDHAVSHNKRLIPVICRDMNSKKVPKSLSKLNWIFLRENDDFDSGIQKLLEAVDINLDWVKAHTRLLTRAIEWERKERDRSLLLRGSDLKEAESWLAESGEKKPKPIELQGQLIIESRKRATAMLRRSLSGVTAGLLIATALSIIAFIQYRLADERGRIAKSRQLAANSEYYTNFEIDLALLLSVEAYKIKPTVQAKDALLGALQKSPKLFRFIQPPEGLQYNFGFKRDDFYNVAYSSDGKFLAWGNSDGTIKLWDVDKGQPLGSPLNGHQEAVTIVAFSPDGKIFASTGRDKTIILWDVKNWQSLEPPLKGHSETVASMAFSPDGKTLASASFDKTIMLWDIATHRLLRPPLTQQKEAVVSVAFSPDGKFLASASWLYSDYTNTGTTILWDIDKQKYMWSPPLKGHRETVNSLAVSPHGKILAGATSDGIMLWDIKTRKALRPPRYKGFGRLVLHPTTGQPLNPPPNLMSMIPEPEFPEGAALIGHKYEVLSVAFSPDGRLLASGGEDDTIRLWDVERRLPLGLPLNGHQEAVTSVAFSPDGKILASTGRDKSILLWDVENRQSLDSTLKGPGGRLVESVAFSPDGKLLASGGFNTTLILWDVKNRQPLDPPLKGPGGSVLSVAFSPDGKLLASGGSGTITLWDIKNRQPSGPPLKGHKGSVESVAFSPDGKLLASGGSRKTTTLWDVKNRQPLDSSLKKPGGSVLSVAFSPDGKLLALGGYNNDIILWDIKNRQPLFPPLKKPGSGVESMAFSPDGKLLASGGSGEIITLWDVKKRQPLTHALQGGRSVAFSPDGRLLASGGDNLRMWDVEVQSWIKRACSISNRDFAKEEWRKFFDDDVPFRKTCPNLPELRE